MPSSKLELKIDQFVLNTEKRIEAVLKKSISDLIEDAQTPTAKGGRMRVDTGFLRSSGVASLNAAPRGPGRGDKNKTYVWEGESLNAVLANLKLGDAFYFGWSAKYARHREAYDAFLETATQKWQEYVDKGTQYFKNKDMSK